MRNALLQREDFFYTRCKLLMRNRLLTLALHIPLPGLFFPEYIFNIHLLAPPSPSSRLHPHYIILPAIFITFTKLFLLKGYDIISFFSLPSQEPLPFQALW